MLISPTKSDRGECEQKGADGRFFLRRTARLACANARKATSPASGEFVPSSSDIGEVRFHIYTSSIFVGGYQFRDSERRTVGFRQFNVILEPWPPSLPKGKLAGVSEKKRAQAPPARWSVGHVCWRHSRVVCFLVQVLQPWLSQR